MTKKTILLTLALLTGLVVDARERINFDKGWRFILGDKTEMAQPTYNPEGKMVQYIGKEIKVKL